MKPTKENSFKTADEVLTAKINEDYANVPLDHKTDFQRNLNCPTRATALKAMQEHASQFGYSAEQMKEQSIKFSEWVRNNYQKGDGGNWCIYKYEGRKDGQEVVFTTEQLYVKFFKDNTLPPYPGLQIMYDKLKEALQELLSNYEYSLKASGMNIDDANNFITEWKQKAGI